MQMPSWGSALPLISTPTVVQEPSSHKGKFLGTTCSEQLQLFSNFLYFLRKTVRIFSFKTICSYNFLLLESSKLVLHCSLTFNIIFENSCKGKILFPALLQIIQISKLVESALALIWSVWEGPQNHFFPQPSLLQIKYLNFFFFPHRSYLTNL